MPNRATNGPGKAHRHRASQKPRDMKLVRLWLPDPNASGFRREARRQALSLRSAPEERDALAFIEATADRGE